MANKRNGGKGGNSGRDPGGFIALPWSVMDCPAYMGLSHPARSLLMELARQFVRDNNGRLLASLAHLNKRGWTSADTITRAKRELIAAGFVHETVKGHRPNKASWFAVTWQTLDRLPGYDAGAAQTFERGAYRNSQPLKNASLKPSGGIDKAVIAPCGGIGKVAATPCDGAMQGSFEQRSTPPDGNHLDMPSVAVNPAARHSICEPEKKVLKGKP